ncbi:DUF2125 domain-containing protein [Rhizobium halophytocola]|uniref:DUF2125 domain-containing protein n=1 Tax=Rhizobium halophytocola TaxID=735519 RepID=A0ABS4E2J6_9HYPH|nr:DUF2125 domain-containing protein [Rhizobium halophytocola]MBP1852179.1 hypothetical protein [Rhizobium halophytocola]
MAQQAQTSKTSRKILLLGLAIVAVCVVYSGAWYVAATTLQGRLERIFKDQNPWRANVTCENQDLRGYPFRIGVFCDTLSFDDPKRGISGTFGALRSAAQVYAPGHIIWELDGPGQVRTTNGELISLEWSDLRSSVVTGLTAIKRSSVEAKQFHATMTPPTGLPMAEVRSPSIETHVRANGDDLDYAAIGRDIELSLDGGKFTLPLFSASVDMTLADRADLMGFRGGETDLHGLKTEIRKVAIALGEKQEISASGPLSVDDKGRLSGNLRLEINGVSEIAKTLKDFAPEAADNIDTGDKVLIALFGGDQKGSAEFKIRKGVVTLGIFPIYTIPPIR